MGDVVGILPAAGVAARLNGIPKFLMPIDSVGTTLLDHHVNLLLQSVSRVLIPVRPENARFVGRFASDSRVVVTALETQSMADTVGRCAAAMTGDSEVLLGMPDTYFSDRNSYAKMLSNTYPHSSFVMGAWKISPEQRGSLGQIHVGPNGLVTSVIDKDPNCKFDRAWGILRLPASALADGLEKFETIGDLFTQRVEMGETTYCHEMDGRYIDCGTFGGLKDLYSTLT